MSSAKDRGVADFVASHRTNTFRSGVGRFNEFLARELGVPMLGLFDRRLPLRGAPLLSFKVSEMDGADRERLEGILDAADWSSRVFLHDWSATPLERRIVRDAEIVFCGNREILERVRGLNPRLELSWSPGLIWDARPFPASEISVFSFGMAHKLRGELYDRLRVLLDASGRDWALYVSSANHETASIQDAQSAFHEISQWVPRGLYFLGNLSDVAVYNYLRDTTFFAAFFDSGVRANNGSVSAAMEHAAVVITNLDEHSPGEFTHMENLIDIERCAELPLEPRALAQISKRAVQTSHERLFPVLVERMAEGVGRRPRS
jgi:hypothetical protein